jgi:hypothetical protein
MTEPNQPSWTDPTQTPPDNAGFPAQDAATPAFATPEAPAPAFAAPETPAPGYAPLDQPTPGYAAPDSAAAGYATGYATPGYAAPGYAAPGYAAPGYPTGGGYGTVPGYGTPGYPAPAYGAPGYGGYPYAPPKPTNGLAIGSMVVSIVSVVGLCFYGLGGFIGILGAILGHVARRQIRENDQNGEGMAKAGIIIGWIATGLAVLVLAGFIVLFVFLADSPGSGGYDSTTYD